MAEHQFCKLVTAVRFRYKAHWLRFTKAAALKGPHLNLSLWGFGLPLMCKSDLTVNRKLIAGEGEGCEAEALFIL